MYADCNGNSINFTDPTGHYSEAIYTLWKYVRGGIQLSKKTVKGYLITAGIEQTVKLVQNLSRANTKKLLEKGYAMPQPAPAPTYRNSKSKVLQDKIKTPTSHPKDFTKLKGNQGHRDKNGKNWKKDKKHNDHWDITNKKGQKIREVSNDGREIYPNGPKNSGKPIGKK